MGEKKKTANNKTLQLPSQGGFKVSVRPCVDISQCTQLLITAHRMWPGMLSQSYEERPEELVESSLSFSGALGGMP